MTPYAKGRVIGTVLGLLLIAGWMAYLYLKARP